MSRMHFMDTPVRVGVVMAMAMVIALAFVDLIGWRDPGFWDFLGTAAAGFVGGYLGAMLRRTTRRER